MTMMQPETSLRRMVPLDDMSRLQFSTTSMKSSFFRYLMPSLRQLIAPVAWMVTPEEAPPARSCIALRLPSWVMYILSTSVLQFCG